MDIETLRGELERLFELDGLIELSYDILGLGPSDVGVTSSKAAFVRALVERCTELELLDALVDAVIALRDDLDPKVLEGAGHAQAARQDYPQGSLFGGYSISRRLGDGPSGSAYVAQRSGREYVVKMLLPELTQNRRAYGRFASTCRLIGRVQHEGIPATLTVERFDSTVALAYEHVEGQTMAARVARSGPMHINEARSILRALLEALAVLHENRIVHGNVKLENILLARAAEPGRSRVVLLDPAVDRLRVLRPAPMGSQDVLVIVSSAKTSAPEQVRGERIDPRTDVYGFGAVMYEILTGKPVFPAKSGIELAIAHLTGVPKSPIDVAPRGWITKDISDFILKLLSRDPASRFADARETLQKFEMLGRAAEVAKKPEKVITDDEVARRIDALVVTPEDEAAAVALDRAVEEGGDVAKIAQAFIMAADQVLEGDEGATREIKKALLFRAARLYQSHTDNVEAAEKAFAWICDLDPNDEIAAEALLDSRKKLGMFEEVIEALLKRVELSSEPDERAEAMADIGHVYMESLDDSAQAVVAYARAYSEAPWHGEYADVIEKLAGNDATLLGEAIAMLADATRGGLAIEHKNRIFLRLAGWYSARLARPDAALPCYQAVMATDPTNDAALEGLENLFRSMQQYKELGQVLLRRADTSSSPAKAREFRCEAADILETKLNQLAKAKELYEQVLQADPSQPRASEALLRIYDKEDNKKGQIAILERRAETQSNEEKSDTLVKVGALWEALKEFTEAVKAYESAATANDQNVTALKALETIYTKSSSFKELLSTLERQAAIATTPRQKITFLERIAKIHEGEFLDYDQAAKALERIIGIDPAHSQSLTALAKHYRALDRWENVAAVYERHLKVTTDKGERLDLLMTWARVLADEVGAPERAIGAYEQILEIDPQHAASLENLAMLRERIGDSQAALKAIEALAAKATTPREKADHFMRAAKLLESRNDLEGAIHRYKLALDANPKETAAFAALRRAYIERGDIALAIELLSREIEFAETPSSKAKYAAEIAKLAFENLKDMTRAELAAKETLTYDPAQIDALVILGDLAYQNERMFEVVHHYETVAQRVDLLPKDVGIGAMCRYLDALSRVGDGTRAVAGCDKLLEIGSADWEAIAIIAKVQFEHGDANKAFKHYQDLLDNHSDKLSDNGRAAALYRYGESARRIGDLTTAVRSLSEAADMDPTAVEPIASLIKVYEANGDWEGVVRVKHQRLDVASGNERVDLLVEIGELCVSKLNDKARAAMSFTTALEERPDDRKLLTRLMQLYSDSKEWANLVEVVLKLADFVNDPKQKAKYIHTAAMVTAEEIADPDKALEYLHKVLELDPSFTKAIEDAIRLCTNRSDFESVEKFLKIRLERATELADRDVILKTFDELGGLYHDRLGWIGESIDAYEAAQMVEPDNAKRNAQLAELYTSNPTEYLEKAVNSQRMLLRKDAYQREPYKLLRRLYTEAKRADAAWCMCQALALLDLAESDEDRFYRRMRADACAASKESLNDDDWFKSVLHEGADPVITAILAHIEPAILAARADTLENLGYDPRYAIDLAVHPYPMSHMIHYAAGLFGMAPPPTFQNINDMGGLSFLHAQIPSIVLGRAAFETELPQQQIAFIVARHIIYYRPGLYVRHLVPTGTGLRAWVLAAIKLNSPQFPISSDLEGPVNEGLKALKQHITGPLRERLASLVSKLLQSGGALDLKRWIAAVDLTADRAGLIVAHDLDVATEMIEVSDEASSPVNHKDRVLDLMLYSISEPYFAVRQKLGIAIDS